MIIYPILIILILLTAFFVVWRRSYFVQKDGVVIDEPLQVQENIRKVGGLFARVKSKHALPAEEPAIQEELSAPPVAERKRTRDDLEVNLESTKDPLMEKAEELFFKKQYISAEKWYLEVVKKDPKNPRIYSRLGLIYISQKNYKDAIACLEEANKIGPALASRCFNLSFAYNEEGRRKEALESARKAMRLDQRNSKYRNWFNELKSRPF